MKIGILGGTFDPPHVGHLIAAQDTFDALSLDKLVFIPARVPPHKQHESVTPAELRLRMVSAAIAGDDRFAVSDVELRRTGPSYTVDTLRDLAQEYPQDELLLLVGVDQVREFSTWREPQEVLRFAKLVMLARSGIEEAPLSGIVHMTVPVTRIDVSSTLIRARAGAGRPIRYLVPEAVEKIILAERLYSGSLG
ncbi:MAG TPA: nicotinate-nucleotide adenylyltransferase [Longimicrobiales bacterium]